MNKGTYDLKKVKILSKEQYAKMRIEETARIYKAFIGREIPKERYDSTKAYYASIYDKIMKNDYDIGYEIPYKVRVKHIVYYDNYFAFIDSKDRLYFIHD